MRQLKLKKLIRKISSPVIRVIHFLGTPRFISNQASENLLANPESRRTAGDLTAGGYNEAFVFQYWASYSPRH